VEPGRSLWEQVVARLQVTPGTPAAQIEIPGGFGPPVPTRHRIGQGTFRVIVTEAYARSCAITRERALPALEAAHIRPFAELVTHSVRNGLLLRSDVHRLFDAGYITVTPSYRVEASRRMKDDFHDGENYLRLHGQRITPPHEIESRPDPEFLRWHNENRFRGDEGG
jgi:putative restriction endonuclease